MIYTPIFIDLFAGAGGLSEGFTREGFQPVAHVESDENACATLTTRLAYQHLTKNNNDARYVEYLLGEIERIDLWNELPTNLRQSVIHEEISDNSIRRIYSRVDKQLNGKKVDVLIGGPPCQAYSLVGRSRDPRRMVGDARNYLFKYYAHFLNRYAPAYFVFENVLGLLTAGNKVYLNEMLRLFRKFGYSIDIRVLNSEDFGVLQKRRRVIVIGRKGTEPCGIAKTRIVIIKWLSKQAM